MTILSDIKLIFFSNLEISVQQLHVCTRLNIPAASVSLYSPRYD